MDVFVIGGGGRESAIAWALANSPTTRKVYVHPGNGGTATMAPGKVVNIAEVDAVDFCARNDIGLVVVGPEADLADGIADRLKVAGIHCFGPSAQAARIETSKAWAKAFMKKYHIPTARYESFKEFEAAEAFIRKQQGRVVVKASGLAAGKGVFVTTGTEEAVQAARNLLVDKIFGDAGSEIIVEELLEGQEISVLAFTDGATVVAMPPARDHKRAFDFNAGPNTGGMGSIAPVPGLSRQLVASIEKRVLQAAVDGLKDEGCAFVGVLFAGVMLTADGPRVLEFNCRFGDPETQVLLPLLQSDLRDVLYRCVTGALQAEHVQFRHDASAATVVVASEGYPGTYMKNIPISRCPTSTQSTLVFHAGTTLTASGELVTSGGRVFAVSAVAPSVAAALSQAYECAESITFQGSWFRRDIGGIYYRPHCKTQPLRIGVLGSTNGTDLPPILQAIRAGELRGAEVVVVISNKAGAGILVKAQEWGVPHKVIPSVNKSREVFDAEVVATLQACDVDLVVLIGFMRILSPVFTDRFAWRMINVHPSLLPDFAGGMDVDVHTAVLAAERKVSGCTVHFVSQEVDGGEKLIQKACEVTGVDTPQSLKCKVQALEAEALVEAISWFSDDAPVSIWAALAVPGSSFQAAVAVRLPAGRLVTSTGPLTYAAAGVDIDAGDNLVEKIKPLARSTRRVGADAELGGFGGIFDLAACGYKDPLLVSSTDGVGTKLRLAITSGLHATVGIDLVAMSVNDLIVQGAEPLLFLDYFATGKLDVPLASQVIAGIAEGCRQAGCALVGGETAEMPSMYSHGDYDLAGFAVGVVERDRVLPRLSTMKAGDILIGIASSGVHSNGYSLVRKVVESSGVRLSDTPPFRSDACTLAEALMTPTRIYIRCLLRMLKEECWVKGMAHITGGGLPDNLPRTLPDHLKAQINSTAWPMPPVFQWLSKAGGGIGGFEMMRTFNCGIGMVLVVDATVAERVLAELCSLGEQCYVIGHLLNRTSEAEAHVQLENIESCFL